MAGNAWWWSATLGGTLALGSLLATATAAAAEPAADAVVDRKAAREAIPGFAAKEHPLPLPTSMTHIDY